MIRVDMRADESVTITLDVGGLRNLRVALNDVEAGHDVTFGDPGAQLVLRMEASAPASYKETGWDLDRLLAEAKNSIIVHRNELA